MSPSQAFAWAAAPPPPTYCGYLGMHTKADLLAPHSSTISGSVGLPGRNGRQGSGHGGAHAAAVTAIRTPLESEVKSGTVGASCLEGARSD